MKAITLILALTLICSIAAFAQPVKFISKAQADSFNVILATKAKDFSTPVTFGDLVMNNKIQAYRFNQTFMTLSKIAKKGEMAKFKKYADSVKTGLQNEASMLAQGIGVIDGQTQNLGTRLNNVEELITVEDALDQDEFKDRHQELFAKIANEVALRNDVASKACREGKGCNHRHY